MTAALAMRAHAPHVSFVETQDDAMAKVLAAAKRAPLVPLTERERVALAEVDDDPSTWQTTEQFMARLAQHPGAQR